MKFTLYTELTNNVYYSYYLYNEMVPPLINYMTNSKDLSELYLVTICLSKFNRLVLSEMYDMYRDIVGKICSQKDLQYETKDLLRVIISQYLTCFCQWQHSSAFD